MTKKRIDWEKVDETIRGYLGLRYHLVGVKIRKSEIEKDEDERRPEGPMAYCQMVRVASSQREAFLYDKTLEACPTAEIILGFRESKYAEIEPRVKPPETRSILIMPLCQMDQEPDVVLVILTPKQLMDLTAILQAEERDLLSVGFRGEAACAEFTAKPYMEHKPNLSLLCSGARLVYSDFRDNELIFGAPPKIYVYVAEVMERAIKTGEALCGCRTSDIPAEIIETFGKVGLSRGTDYFFGKIDGDNVRIYLNKDLKGMLKFVTFHFPTKLPSEEEAKGAKERLDQLLLRPYRASHRSYWLNLSMTATIDELSLDLLDERSVKIASKEFINKAKGYLHRVGVEA